jgi:peptidoglycan/LPS O-acetylase OafA/YrhL
MIVVMIIHLPNNYAYNFFMELDAYTGFFFHTLGIDVALGGFTFLSGFGLFLQKNNRGIDNRDKLFTFIKKRLLRIFPLYWIALILFLIFFEFYSGMDIIYLLAHVLGMQIVVAPLYGSPIWTLWFIGIIILYYFVFIILSYLETSKKIIPASLAIFVVAIFLHFNFDLIEIRFFVYYLPFVLGIITADFYTSTYYLKIKEKLQNLQKLAIPAIVLCSAIIGWILYTDFARYAYSYYRSNYATQFLQLIVKFNISELEFVNVILITDFIIIAYIVFMIAVFNLLIRVLSLVINRAYIVKALAIGAYSTFAVYLFHRPFLIIFNSIMLDIFNIDMLLRSNFYFIFLSIPMLFLLSFLIQKTADKSIHSASKKVSDRINRNNNVSSSSE